MRTLILAIFLSLSFTSLLDSQLIKPRNPIMVINCEEVDERNKFLQLITPCGVENLCGEGFICVGGFCYPECNPESEVDPPEGTICMEIYDGDEDYIYILVPDCSDIVGNGILSD